MPDGEGGADTVHPFSSSIIVRGVIETKRNESTYVNVGFKPSTVIALHTGPDLSTKPNYYTTIYSTKFKEDIVYFGRVTNGSLNYKFPNTSQYTVQNIDETGFTIGNYGAAEYRYTHYIAAK